MSDEEFTPTCYRRKPDRGDIYGGLLWLVISTILVTIVVLGFISNLLL